MKQFYKRVNSLKLKNPLKSSKFAHNKIVCSCEPGDIYENTKCIRGLGFFFKVYLFFEREREQGRGRQRKTDRQTEASMWGSNSRKVRSYPELKSRVDCLTD